MRTLKLSAVLFAFTVPFRFPCVGFTDPCASIQKLAAACDPDQRVKAIRMASETRSAESIRAIAAMLGDPHLHVRREALRALSGLADPAAIEYLSRTAAKASNEMIRAGAIETLGRARAGGTAEPLLAAIRDGSPAVRVSALGALRSLGDASAADAVAGRLKDAAWAVRAAAVEALAELDPGRAGDRLAPCLADRDYQVRIAAVERLTRLVPDRSAEILKKALTDPAWQVRVAAIEAAEALRRPEIVPLLIERLGVEKGRLRGDLLRALHDLTGNDIGLDAKRWGLWWQANGKDFTCPDAAHRAEASHQTAVAAFCGIPIYSHRVAFVLDLSGSMRDAADEDDAQLSSEGRARSENTAVVREKAADLPSERRDAKAVTPSERKPNASPVAKPSGAADADGPRKVDVVKAEMLRAIRTFTYDTHFNVILIGSDAEGRFNEKERMWAGRLVPATPEALSHAARFIERQPARGYTNLYDAVARAFQDPEVDTIVLLSDGGASRGTLVARQDILDVLTDMNRYRKIRIDTVQSGARRAGDRWLMEELAAQTGGATVRR